MGAQRRKRGRPRSRSAPALLRGDLTVKKRKQYSDELMKAVLESVKSGNSISRAACEHDVPRQTLQDCVYGRVVHGSKPGPNPYLSQTEEKELSSFLVDVAKAGYGKSRKQVKRIAESVACEKGSLETRKYQTVGSGNLWRGSPSFHFDEAMQLPMSDGVSH